ncbi:MAG: HAD family hydrolase [Candidatus Omnitrophica bacterium]|jgi:HAD superfamily hydrolase (TIGR01549 family)|nr:HAD family hydrolase [Candidatus Omnitrophota bacterium]
MIKAIIFDFDGVLVESVDIKTKAFRRLFEHEGKEIADMVESYHIANTGVSRFDKFRYFYKTFLKRELRDAEFNDLCKRFSALVKEEVIKAPYVTGAREFLQSRKDFFDFFITTATPQAEMEWIVEQRGISAFFKALYGAPVKKEDAVNDIIRRFALMPDETAYVGDALSDMQAARANSVNFIARVYEANKEMFGSLDCVKINNMTSLDRAIKSLG